MERDIRTTPLFLEVESHFRNVYAPAFGRVSGTSGPVASPDGRKIAFTGSKLDKLEGTPSTRVFVIDLETGELDEVTGGPNDDKLPRWSPDGSRLAFLSDRARKGEFQLYLLAVGRMGEALSTPAVDGTVEAFAWSPEGRAILLQVAGRGADLAGVQGSGTTQADGGELPSWIPSVDRGVAENEWRTAYLYELETRAARRISRDGLNIWEAVWGGPRRLAAIVSDDPREDAWYSAPLALIDVESGQERVVHRSPWQLGLPAASPSGERLAVVEALCSDRAVVAGNVLLIDPCRVPIHGGPVPIEGGPEVTRIDTAGVDVTSLEWRDENCLLFAGLRGLHAVVGEYDAESGEVRELWETEGTCGSFVPEASPLDGSFVTVAHSYDRYPELAVVREGQARTVTRMCHEGAEYLTRIGGRQEAITWTAPDGIEIQGFLITPEGDGPHPLIVNVHGGPVSAFQNRWLGSSTVPWLVSRGYAVLMPNPRGSWGRGQDFVRMVYGDMGGDDALDILAGIDALIERGIADPARLGVTGGSYGGFMSAWLITQTDRFAAAVVMSPVTDWYSQHRTSNIGEFDRLFLQDDPSNPAGRYFERSPVMFARQVKTPTLHTAGARDRCTPPTQAIEFHQALLENGVESVLLLYPEEGHGVRQMPAGIDVCARITDWFERHMPLNK